MKLTHKRIERMFVCYFHWVDLFQISLGITIDFRSPNLEIHLPFCFFRIGWIGTWADTDNEDWGIPFEK